MERQFLVQISSDLQFNNYNELMYDDHFLGVSTYARFIGVRFNVPNWIVIKSFIFPNSIYISCSIIEVQ